MNKKFLILTVAAGAALCQNLFADVVAIPAAAQEILQTYRGTRVHTDQGRVRIIYGAPMTPGVTAEHAAATWLQLHGEAFGCPDPDLRLDWSTEIEDGKFTVFAFQQYLDDMPVEMGIARILVLNRPVPRVVYAAGTLTPGTPQELAAPLLDGPTAVELVRAQRMYQALPEWSEPEMAVFQGLGEWQAPVRVWKFIGEDPELAKRQRWTFFVHATTGQLLHIRNEVLHQNDITGTVRGRGTPGTRPDIPSNPPVLLNLGDIRLSVFNGTSGFANPDGSFVLPHFGIEPVTLRSRLGTAPSSGRWVHVIDDSNPMNPALGLQLQVTPPGPVDLIFNNTPNEAATAQVNAFVHTNMIHGFFRSRSGDWDRIDTSVRATVNIDDNCNAFYVGGTINFFSSGGGCTNSAYSSVISHEYGHHIVNQLGIGQGGFGEGFADACAHLLYDDPIVGREFGPGMSRQPLVENVQYECDDEIHYCGMLLSGVWYRTRQNMGSFYGSQEGLERTQQMFVSWALITTGGTGLDFVNSAHPGTAIEMLTINDDDGDLTNGTPDLPRLCNALGQHNIECPATAAVKWEFPQELPALLTPEQPTTIDVNVLPMGAAPIDNTGTIFYRVNAGSWVQSSMTRLAAHQYRGTIPGQTCGSVVDYYFRVGVAGLGTVTYPESAPGRAIFVPVAESVSVAFEDDFEQDRGWIDHDDDDDATTGRWTRGIPEATPAQPGENVTPDGALCWVTDHRAGVQVSDYDVDDGKTTLISPLLNLQGRNNPIVSFWLWYSNDVGPVNPGTNILDVDVTADDGASWVTAITLGPNGEETSGGWRLYRFRLNDFVPTTAQVRVRFVASDQTNSIVEAAVDDFAVLSLNCGPGSTFGCYANCDGSTTEPVLNVDDFLCFVDRFAAGDPWANCDGSTTAPVLNVDDFLCFISTFAEGCR